ncbi:MAG: hypothetical protein AAF542_18605 [Pseudomonadota bacterium]
MSKIRLLIALIMFAGSHKALAQDSDDRVLNLESTFQGNREQPRVLYIVPWQQPDGPPELERPISGDIDQLFEPIDRTSFQRELKYIKFLQEGAQKTDSPQLFE